MLPVGVKLDPDATVRAAELLTDPNAAQTAVDPVATPVATPALLMVATLVADEVHVTEVVKSRVVLSL
jgi:hypothetical protein